MKKILSKGGLSKGAQICLEKCAYDMRYGDYCDAKFTTGFHYHTIIKNKIIHHANFEGIKSLCTVDINTVTYNEKRGLMSWDMIHQFIYLIQR